jgi:hypothetical protein
VLRGIFGRKRDEVTGSGENCRMRNFAIYAAYHIYRVIKSRRMRWAGHVACMGDKRGAYRVLMGKPEEKRPLGRPRRRWEDDIKMDIQELGCGAWTGLIWLGIGTGGGLS